MVSLTSVESCSRGVKQCRDVMVTSWKVFVFLSISSAFSQAEGKQKELVWSQSLCGDRCGWPVQEDWEVQQYTQSQMEARSHRVSILLILGVEVIGELKLVWTRSFSGHHLWCCDASTGFSSEMLYHKYIARTDNFKSEDECKCKIRVQLPVRVWKWELVAMNETCPAGVNGNYWNFIVHAWIIGDQNPELNPDPLAD